jgi:hypothetical protein
LKTEGIEMAKKWKELVATTLTSAQQEQAAALTQQMRAEMPLQELRRARELSQTRIAEILGREQGDVSKLEHRTDMYVSTLRSYIEAMGGRLDIIAHFPEGDVRITQFEAIGERKAVA